MGSLTGMARYCIARANYWRARMGKCSPCGGTGRVNLSRDHRREMVCPTCEGHGVPNLRIKWEAWGKSHA